MQLDKDIPIFKLNEELTKKAKVWILILKNPLLRDIASNYFKRMI